MFFTCTALYRHALQAGRSSAEEREGAFRPNAAGFCAITVRRSVKDIHDGATEIQLLEHLL